MRAPFRRPWHRCQQWWSWRQVPVQLDVCTSWRWHRGHHMAQTWRLTSDGWILPYAATGSNDAGRVFR